MGGMAAEAYRVVPAPKLRTLVDSYSGIRYEGWHRESISGCPRAI